MTFYHSQSSTPVDDDVMSCRIIMFCFVLNAIKLICRARVGSTFSFNPLSDFKSVSLQHSAVTGLLGACRGGSGIEIVSKFCVSLLFSHWCHIESKTALKRWSRSATPHLFWQFCHQCLKSNLFLGSYFCSFAKSYTSVTTNAGI